MTDTDAYNSCAGESVNAAAVSLKLQQHLSVQLPAARAASAAIIVTAPRAMKQRVRFAAAASGAATLVYIAYRELRHLATRRRKLEALGRVDGRFQAASLDQMVRICGKGFRFYLASTVVWLVV